MHLKCCLPFITGLYPNLVIYALEDNFLEDFRGLEFIQHNIKSSYCQPILYSDLVDESTVNIYAQRILLLRHKKYKNYTRAHTLLDIASIHQFEYLLLQLLSLETQSIRGSIW